jgi:hypothetical protein
MPSISLKSYKGTNLIINKANTDMPDGKLVLTATETTYIVGLFASPFKLEFVVSDDGYIQQQSQQRGVQAQPWSLYITLNLVDAYGSIRYEKAFNGVVNPNTDTVNLVYVNDASFRYAIAYIYGRLDYIMSWGGSSTFATYFISTNTYVNKHGFELMPDKSSYTVGDIINIDVKTWFNCNQYIPTDDCRLYFSIRGGNLPDQGIRVIFNGPRISIDTNNFLGYKLSEGNYYLTMNDTGLLYSPYAYYSDLYIANQRTGCG